MQIKSIRTFIGSKNFEISRNFYLDLGFKELILSEKMSSFTQSAFGFYLQNYYAKDWVDNSMIFLEIENLQEVFTQVKSKKLDEKYKGVRLSQIQHNNWGSEFFLHDPSGVLWHIGNFKE